MKTELTQEYKKREITGGIVGIRNTITGKVLLQAATDIHGKQQRFDFAMQSNSSTVFLPLQADWKKYGKDAFEFVQYDTITRKDETDYEFLCLLKELEKQWREKLGEICL